MGSSFFMGFYQYEAGNFMTFGIKLSLLMISVKYC